VRLQIVRSLGDLEQPAALLQIVNVEPEGLIRYTALSSLGRAGAVGELAAMYKTASINSRRSIIEGLAFARAEAQLIQVATIERKGNPELRRFALEQLKLFGSPRANEYLQQESLQKRDEKR
jgi:HEAT repeat protein